MFCLSVPRNLLDGGLFASVSRDEFSTDCDSYFTGLVDGPSVEMMDVFIFFLVFRDVGFMAMFNFVSRRITFTNFDSDRSFLKMTCTMS